MPRHRMQFKTFLRKSMKRDDMVGDFARHWQDYYGSEGDIEQIKRLYREAELSDLFDHAKAAYDAECGTAVFG